MRPMHRRSKPIPTPTTGRTGRTGRPWRCAGGAPTWFAALALLSGCVAHSPATFPAAGPQPVWPLPPDPPRIRYLGELLGPESMGRRSTGLKAVGEWLGGRPEPLMFVNPMAVAVRDTTLYVADPGHPTGPLVHQLEWQERRSTVLRSAGGAPLEWPIDVAIFQGQLAIADARRAAVFLLAADGRTVATIGQGQLQRPAAVAACADGSELWVLDAAAHAVLIFDAAGTLRTRLGGRGSAPGEFNYPAGLSCLTRGGAAHLPAAALADSMNFRIQTFDERAGPLRVFGRKGDAAGDFSLPRDVAIDSHGQLYVLDNQFENVQIFSPDGQLLLAFGREGRGPGQFSLPSGITIDGQDRIWIADTYNRRVQVFQYLHREAQPPALSARYPVLQTAASEELAP